MLRDLVSSYGLRFTDLGPAVQLTDSSDPPKGVLAWFTISSLVVLWDAAYIFSRPHSFQGGKWHWIWSP